LIASSYKIVDSQTSLTICEGIGVGNLWKGQSRKISEARNWSQTFYLRLCNPATNNTKFQWTFIWEKQLLS